MLLRGNCGTICFTGLGNRTYALRNRVRLDSSGVLIPLYPPSRAEIAIAQGRKPFIPKRTKVQATTAWSKKAENVFF